MLHYTYSYIFILEDFKHFSFFSIGIVLFAKQESLSHVKKR